MTVKPEHIEWSRQMFKTLSEGGKWGVPRSGLIFTKQGNALVLTDVMPHDPAMPITPEQLVDQQDRDFKIITEHFGAAGVDVQKGEQLMEKSDAEI